MPELSVVLISKNQAWNIGRLIDSVLQGTAAVLAREIVLVDSASTDKTVALAAGYPVRVLQLQPEQPLSPAAGRYVGSQHVHGKWILFLDGDMELCPGWIERALRVIQAQPDVAVVTGPLIDVLPTTLPEQKPRLPLSLDGCPSEVPVACGAALYRRSVLEAVGTFNPYLCSEEEPELCLRIRHAGFRVVELSYPIAYHYSQPSDAFSTLLRRWQANLYLGDGQVLRYHLRSPVLWTYLRERGYVCLPGFALGIGVGSALWALHSQSWSFLMAWFLLLGVVIISDAYRKRSLGRTIFSLLHRLIIVDGTIRGFFRSPLPPESYPSKLLVVKG
ncbi:MAG: glycosyltransferase family 2 protein [Candidatus Binatia bacterium]